MKPSASLRQRLLDFVSAPRYQPLKQHELARALHVKGNERQALRQLLRQMEREGALVCLRKNRWGLPLSGHYIEARLSVLPSGGAIATTAETPAREFFVGRSGLAGAIHEDRVQLQLTGRTRRARSAAQERATARVVRVLERGARTVVGLIERSRFYWYVIPDSPRIQENVHVRDVAPGLEPHEHHKAVVLLDDWAGPGTALKGTLIEDLGAADSSRVGLVSLMREHHLQERFEENLLEEARRRSPTLSADDLADREDLRGLLTFTIDPEDARDFDDAVSLVPLPDGGWDVGVHIADVSHFVRPGTEVDREAYVRGNSVYLVGGFVPMLPKHLTSDVCSLRPHVDRLAYSVLLRVDAHGHIRASRAVPSVIHSAARLDYDQVQRHFDGKGSEGIPHTVVSALNNMRGFAAMLRRRRMATGSIDLSLPEVKCILDDQLRPVELKRRGAPEAYHLIEELMLLANVAVAERLSGRRVPAIYRIHEEPSDEQWAKMAADLEMLNIHRRPRDRAEINAICRDAAGTPLEYSVNLAVLRNLKRALYSDRLAEHFGLGFSRYTHFTSPIRRYPDLVVHRLLRAVETGSRMPYTHDDVRRIAQHCSETERNADAAEEQSLVVKRIEYYAARLDEGDRGPHRALVTSVIARGVIAELVDSLQRGLIPLSQLRDDFYEANPERGYVRGRRGRHTIRVGDLVDVDLLRVDTARRLVDFRLAEPAREPRARRAARSQRKAKRHRMR